MAATLLRALALSLGCSGAAWAGLAAPRAVPVLTPSLSPLGSASAAPARLGLTPVLTPSLGGALAAPGLPALPSLPNLPSPVLPSAAVPSLAPTIVPVAAALPAAPAAPDAAVPDLRAALESRLAGVSAAQAADPTGVQASLRLGALYAGAPAEARAAVDAGITINGEGVSLVGRAAVYYRKIQNLIAQYRDSVDLSESVDVMADSYGDVWAKIKALEALGKGSGRNNTHLEQTLTWVDGVMDERGRRTAIHTHRVFFHHSPNPRSEIAEGIRRVDRYLKDTVRQFSSGGKAEDAMGRFDEVLLVFDTRGYKEIKDHLRGREAEFAKAGLRRYRFAFLDEIAAMPADESALRAELNDMTRRYKGRELEKIIEGVTYGRYVGLLLELATIDHYVRQGWTVVQSGHEVFDAEGMYLTELDVVARSPEGRTALVEAKSARVPIPQEEVLRDKVIAKLEAYSRNRATLEAAIGRPIDEVVFSFDVGSNAGLASFTSGARPTSPPSTASPCASCS